MKKFFAFCAIAMALASCDPAQTATDTTEVSEAEAVEVDTTAVEVAETVEVIDSIAE